MLLAAGGPRQTPGRGPRDRSKPSQMRGFRRPGTVGAHPTPAFAGGRPAGPPARVGGRSPISGPPVLRKSPPFRFRFRKEKPVMQRSRFVAAITSLALFLTAAVALAEPTVYKLDGAHTQVGFSIRHFFSKVPGQFDKFDGSIKLDDKNWSNSSVEATIDAASIDTNNEKRDTHLKSADFL